MKPATHSHQENGRTWKKTRGRRKKKKQIIVDHNSFTETWTFLVLTERRHSRGQNKVLLLFEQEHLRIKVRLVTTLLPRLCTCGRTVVFAYGI